MNVASPLDASDSSASEQNSPKEIPHSRKPGYALVGSLQTNKLVVALLTQPLDQAHPRVGRKNIQHFSEGRIVERISSAEDGPLEAARSVIEPLFCAGSSWAMPPDPHPRDSHSASRCAVHGIASPGGTANVIGQSPGSNR